MRTIKDIIRAQGFTMTINTAPTVLNDLPVYTAAEIYIMMMEYGGEVVDQCAQQAETKPDGDWGRDGEYRESRSVDKESIMKVKQLIK